jgi:hypothetical protein
MKLRTSAKKLLKRDRKLRLKLALALGFSEQWVVRLIEDNKENGPLTTIQALGTIKKETGLSEADILEECVAGVQN